MSPAESIDLAKKAIDFAICSKPLQPGAASAGHRQRRRSVEQTCFKARANAGAVVDSDCDTQFTDRRYIFTATSTLAQLLESSLRFVKVPIAPVRERQYPDKYRRLRERHDPPASDDRFVCAAESA
jgi:hypothetical protein